MGNKQIAARLGIWSNTVQRSGKRTDAKG